MPIVNHAAITRRIACEGTVGDSRFSSGKGGTCSSYLHGDDRATFSSCRIVGEAAIADSEIIIAQDCAAVLRYRIVGEGTTSDDGYSTVGEGTTKCC